LTSGDVTALVPFLNTQTGATVLNLKEAHTAWYQLTISLTAWPLMDENKGL